MKKFMMVACSLFATPINAQEATNSAISSNKDAVYHKTVGALKLTGAAVQTCVLAKASYNTYKKEFDTWFFLGIVGALGHGTYETYRSAFSSLSKAKNADKKEDAQAIKKTTSLTNRLQNGAVGIVMTAAMASEIAFCYPFWNETMHWAKKYNKKHKTERLLNLGLSISAILTIAFGAYKSGTYAWQSFRKAFRHPVKRAKV